MRSVTVTSPGRPRLHVTCAGAGEPVLAITGWTISSAIFAPFVPLLPEGFRAIAFDHRGSGRSQWWPTPVSVATLAADAGRALDAAGERSAHVVGVSLGAAVALELAVRMPWRVRSLALVGGWAGGPTSRLPAPAEASAVIARLARDSARRRRLWPAAMLFSPEYLAAAPPAAVEAAVEPFLVRRAGTSMTWAQTVAASCFNRRRELAALRCPTLVAHGVQDAMSPVENARRMAAAIPGCRLELRPGGHAFPFEDLDDTAALARSWLGEVAGTDPAVRATPVRRTTERATRPLALHAGAARNQRDLLLRLAGRA